MHHWPCKIKSMKFFMHVYMSCTYYTPKFSILRFFFVYCSLHFLILRLFLPTHEILNHYYLLRHWNLQLVMAEWRKRSNLERRRPYSTTKALSSLCSVFFYTVLARIAFANFPVYTVLHVDLCFRFYLYFSPSICCVVHLWL